jgi:predicted membrane chloride channel (bestrophin family)
MILGRKVGFQLAQMYLHLINNTMKRIDLVQVGHNRKNRGKLASTYSLILQKTVYFM